MDFSIGGTIIALCILNIFLVFSSTVTLRNYFKMHREFNPLRLENENYKATQRTMAKVYHNINHKARIFINKTYRDIIIQEKKDASQRHIAFEKFILFLLGNIKEMFDLLTKDQCSVCIKLLIPDENPEQTSVKTHFRDTISVREREKADSNLQQYPYYENTAFKRIIRPQYPDSFYFCNDLKNEKEYINLNPQWRDYYNACLVVPIAIPQQVKDKGKEHPAKVIIGFICIDNFKGGFDKVVTGNILASIADLTYLVYKSYYDYTNFINKTSQTTPPIQESITQKN